jgi:hypothetical protein
MCARVLGLLAAALLPATAAGQADLPAPPSVLPFAETVPPSPAAVEVLAGPYPLRPPPWTVTAEIGVGGGDFSGTVIPPRGFKPSRPYHFPLPSARLDGFVNPRVAIARDLAPLVPGVLGVEWQGFSAEGEAILFGYDPVAAVILPVIERARRRGKADLYPALLIRPTPAHTAHLRSRADINLLDATYTDVLWERWDAVHPSTVVRWKVGGRLGGFFNDDQAVAFGYDQWVSNWYIGAGPLVGLSADVPLDPQIVSGMQALFVGVDGGVLFGRNRQRFRETDLFADRPRYREAVVCGDRAVPFLSVEAGVAHRPLAWERVGTRFGVRYVQFWGVADLGPSKLDFHAVTGFVGLDFRF